MSAVAPKARRAILTSHLRPRRAETDVRPEQMSPDNRAIWEQRQREIYAEFAELPDDEPATEPEQTPAPKSEPKQKMATLTERVLQRLRSAPEGMGARKLSEAFDISIIRIRNALTNLEDRGAVRKQFVCRDGYVWQAVDHEATGKEVPIDNTPALRPAEGG